ncbi:hypothetical protein CAPTEDRAFT_216306 [Capitella teleta]|uniref:Ileal sodium/bile acid cotransporter n=1 Tax=Capitella teleta TaxID=283909 RepID=R7UKX0_CAPTE|nr:hypothetical protein CAPTEDRAFT_216306 [Capitella teleta]|eukprot:ELU03907.1 hypothetical protein CAPTEDRAFT_216306 [Capitella teleta]
MPLVPDEPWLSTGQTPTNGTTLPPTDPTLLLAYNIAMLITTAWLMFSMGSGTRIEVIKERLKRPVGPIIGLICQFFILPALMFGFAHALDVDDGISIGMILTASCPGGSVSNMLTFWCHGDLDLSITMTSISTFLAIGFMPLNMYIYVRSWMPVSDIPFVDMVITIVVVWATVILGNLFGRFFPKAVPYLTKVGSVVGFVFVLTCAAIQSALFPEVFDLSWTVWFCAVMLPIIAWLIGFFVPLIFKQGLPQRVAIAFEVSAQNMALAITIIAIAYDTAEEASFYSQFVILYGSFVMVVGVTISIIFNLIICYRARSTPCHQYTRNKEQKEKGTKPDIKRVTTNGTTLTVDEDDSGQLPTIYRGGSFQLSSTEEQDLTQV